MARRGGLVLALALMLVLGGAAVSGGYYALEWFRHMHAERNILIHQAAVSRVLKPDRAGLLPLLFIGDSIFAAYPLRALWPDDFILFNRGGAGDTMAEIAARYEKLRGAEARCDVVLIGGRNDLIKAIKNEQGGGEALLEVVQAASQIFSTARRRRVTVTYISAFPLRPRFLLPYSKRGMLPNRFDIDSVNENVELMNRRMKSLCQNSGHRFWDIHDLMRGEDGYLRNQYSATDGRHLSIRGYVALTEALLPAFATRARLQ